MEREVTPVELRSSRAVAQVNFMIMTANGSDDSGRGTERRWNPADKEPVSFFYFLLFRVERMKEQSRVYNEVINRVSVKRQTG